MKNYLFIALFTLFTSIAYTMIGFMLPQKVGEPPPIIKLGVKAEPSDLAEAGQVLFQNECSACHMIGAPGGRGPDVSGVGDRAIAIATQKGGDYTGVDYLLESMCRPNDYVVDGYAAFMTNFDGKLDGGQMLALVAFLQDQGAAGAEVNGLEVDIVSKYCPKSVAKSNGGSGGGGPAAVAEAPKPKIETVEEAIKEFNCAGCHSLDSTTAGAGPGLGDVGARLNRDQLKEALLQPGATLAEGYADIMTGSLDGFSDRMSPDGINALVDYLENLKGE